MAATAIAARPPVGRAMDLRGRRLVFVGGSALLVVTCALYLTVTSLGVWLVAVRIAHGLAEAMTFSSLFTYVSDIVPPERRTEGIALFGVSGLLPMSLAGLLGDQVIALFGYRELFGLTVVFALVGLVLVLPLRDAAAPAGPGRRGIVAAAIQPDLLPLWFMGSVFAIALASVFTFLKTFVLATGIGSVGMFFTAYAAAAVILRLTLAWLPDRVGPKRALFPAVACLALGLLSIAFASGSTSLAVAGALTGLGHGFTFPILSGLVVTRARDDERGAAMSLFTAVFDLGVLVGGPTLGASIEAWGYPTTFAIASALVVAGAVAFAFWDHRR